MSQLTREILANQERDVECKFDRASRQVYILNNKIMELEIRYDRALKEGRKSFSDTLSLHLATTDCVRDMYFKYALQKADELEMIQNQLYGELSDSEEDSEEDIDSDQYWWQRPSNTQKGPFQGHYFLTEGLNAPSATPSYELLINFISGHFK